MKKIIFIISIFISITQTSCISSLQPLVTYNTAVADDRITGTWENDGQQYLVQRFFSSDFYKKNKEDFEKEREKNKGQLTERTRKDSILYSKSYLVNYNKEGVRYELFGSMMHLSGQLFINFTGVNAINIDSSKKGTEVDLPDRINTCTIARVEFNKPNSVKLDFIDGGFVYDQVKAGRMKIKNEKEDLYDTFLITASTMELRQFLEKYGNDPRFFNKKNSVTLTHKSR